MIWQLYLKVKTIFIFSQQHCTYYLWNPSLTKCEAVLSHASLYTIYTCYHDPMSCNCSHPALHPSCCDNAQLLIGSSCCITSGYILFTYPLFGSVCEANIICSWVDGFQLFPPSKFSLLVLKHHGDIKTSLLPRDILVNREYKDIGK